MFRLILTLKLTHRLPAGDKYTNTVSKEGEVVLTIHDFSWTDVGEYSLEITNDLGTTSRAVVLQMSGKLSQKSNHFRNLLSTLLSIDI